MKKRSELRRQWREDQKDLKVKIKFREWTPATFDEVKAAIRKATGS
jgi:hypothetical protein